MYAKEKFGNVEVIILPKKAPGIPATPAKKTGRSLKTKDTGFKSAAILSIRKVVKSVIQGFGEDMESVASVSKASSVELEFSLSLSAEGDLAIMQMSGEGTITVKMTWENKKA